MRRLTVLLPAVLLAGCVSAPKCGNPEGARTILTGKESCLVRIRQVTVGSDLKIPASLKGAVLSEFALDWVEPGLQDGRIELGHFVLLPVSQTAVKK